MKDVGTIELETERLVLRRLEITDAEGMFDGWCNDSDVTRYLPWDVHGDISVTKELLKMWIDDYNNKFTYRWIVTEKNSKMLLGTIDVVKKDMTNKVFDIGYCYRKESWGKGHATEALKAVIELLFEQVGVELIVAKHYITNPASGRVMQKAGMKYDATLRDRIIDSENNRIAEVVYSLRKDEFIK